MSYRPSVIAAAFALLLSGPAFAGGMVIDPFITFSAPAGGTDGALVSIQRGTVSYDSGDGAAPPPVSISTVDADNAFLSFSQRGGVAFTALANRHNWRGDLADGEIQFTRYGASSSGTTTIEWEAVEFDDSVLVQRGTSTVTTPVTNITLGTEVDPTRSFVLFTTSTNQLSLTHQTIVRASLTGTTLTFATYDPIISGAIVVSWQVIQFPAGAASVQYGTIALDRDESSDTFTLSSSVNTANTFVVSAGFTAISSPAAPNHNFRLRLTDSTTVTADKSTYGNDSWFTIGFFVVEMLNGTTVNHITGVIPDTASVPTTQPSFTAMSNPSLALSSISSGPNGWLSSESVSEDNYLTTYVVDGTKDGLTIARQGVSRDFTFSIDVIDWYKP